MKDEFFVDREVLPSLGVEMVGGRVQAKHDRHSDERELIVRLRGGGER